MQGQLAGRRAQASPQTHQPLRAAHPSRIALPRSRRTASRILALGLPDLDGLTGSYVGLSLAALGFVGTFGLAPRFKDAFKEPLDWGTIYADLVARGGVKTISVQEAYEKAKKGHAVLLDVRLARKYEERHPAFAISAPLYLPIQKWDLASNIRRAGFSFFGIYGTELNPRFAEDAAAVVGKGKEVMVICEMGGSLDNKPGVTKGFQSRSLKAIYELQNAGYTKLTHVQGGLIQWGAQKLPYDDDEGEDTSAAKEKEGVLVSLFGRKQAM